MRIAIDLNDVIRDFTPNFIKYYQEGVDRKFDETLLDVTTNDMRKLLPFYSDEHYNRFTYEDYAWELFGKCPACDGKIVSIFNDWITKYVRDIDIDEPIDLVIVSTKEYGLSIAGTLFFLSKIGCKCRNYFFPQDTNEIWDTCDILITANPTLLKSKPEKKITVKISTDYNNEIVSDFSFDKASKFMEGTGNTEKVIEKYKENI